VINTERFKRLERAVDAAGSLPRVTVEKADLVAILNYIHRGEAALRRAERVEDAVKVIRSIVGEAE
jgi:hypothetical protein